MSTTMRQHYLQALLVALLACHAVSDLDCIHDQHVTEFLKSVTSQHAYLVTTGANVHLICLQVPLPPMPEGLEAELLEDLENRVSLSDAALPSAVFYTFVNTHHSLNCVSFSSSGAMVAGE